MADKNTIYVATESFVTTIDGEEVVIRKGTTRVRAGHKLLKGRERLFEPLTIQYDTESATSAPGEQREAKKPAPEPLVKEPSKEATKKASTAESGK